MPRKSEMESAIERLDVLLETVKPRLEPRTLAPTKAQLRAVINLGETVIKEYYRDKAIRDAAPNVSSGIPYVD